MNIQLVQGQLVCRECFDKCAKYLAWIDKRTCVNPIHKNYVGYAQVYGEVYDLSYRSTFNDKPGPEDLPIYDVQVITTWHRVAKIR